MANLKYCKADKNNTRQGCGAGATATHLWEWIFVQEQGNVVEAVLVVQTSGVNAATKGRDGLQIADFQVQGKGAYLAYVTEDETAERTQDAPRYGFGTWRKDTTQAGADYS